MVLSGEVGIQDVINCKDYSRRKRLVRITAWVLKFKNAILAKIRLFREDDDSVTSKDLEEPKVMDQRIPKGIA